MPELIVTAAAGALGVTLSTTATAIWTFATSVVLSAITAALSAPKQQALTRNLSYPSTVPPYRFVYGNTRAVGSPAGVPVRSVYIYGCWILNSRPSAGPFKLIMDKREVLSTGDPYDFTMAGGGLASVSPFVDHVRYWIGRGDQTSPPAQILAEAPWVAGDDDELWKPTDAWQGRTVIWMRINAGKNKFRQQRWPSSPPLIEVDGQWSLVWDPRDLAQDPDDPSTWEYSDNHALCTLDALRVNPVRAYQLRNLHLPSWIESADASDEIAPLKSGGSEPRYRVGGTLAFDDNEIEDQVQPLVLAGAADLIRVGGRLGLAPGVWRAPLVTLDDLFDGEFRYEDLSDGDSLPTEVRATYTNAERGYETAELAPWPIPGAAAADGGLDSPLTLQVDFINSPTQAMRVRKITGLKRRRQRSLSGVAPPEFIEALAGSTVTVDVPEPYGTVMNGTYEVQEIAPAFDPTGLGGMALRCPIKVVEHSASIYAWNPATEEEDVVEVDYDSSRNPVAPPGAISVVTGAAVAQQIGSLIIPQILFAFDQSTSAAVDSYGWEFQIGSNDWQAGGYIENEIVNGSDAIFGFVTPVDPGETYNIRVWAIAGLQESDRVSIFGVIPTDPSEIAIGDLVDPGILGRSRTVTGLPEGDAFVTGDGVWWIKNSDGHIVTNARWVADFAYGQFQTDQVARLRSSVLSHTRASTATYIADDGTIATAGGHILRYERVGGSLAALIEPAASTTNLYSEEMDNAYWTKNLGIVTANAGVAPDGASSADLFLETAASGIHRIIRSLSFTAAGVYTISGFYKPSGRDGVAITLNSASFGVTTQVRYVCSTLATIVSLGTVSDAGIEAIGAGWYRVWVTLPATATAASNVEFRLVEGTVANYLGDVTKGGYFWGLNVTDGAYGSYIPAAAAIGSRSADVPGMQGLIAMLDIDVVYGDGTTQSFPSTAVSPGVWPTLTSRHIRRMVGRTP